MKSNKVKDKTGKKKKKKKQEQFLQPKYCIDPRPKEQEFWELHQIIK